MGFDQGANGRRRASRDRRRHHPLLRGRRGKPDPEIFEIALAAIDCAPDAALFVDDTEENVEAARAVGMEGHLHLDRRGTIEAIDGFLARTPA